MAPVNRTEFTAMMSVCQIYNCRPNNLAVLRHMALNVMQKDPVKGSLRGKRKRASWDESYLRTLLALF